MRENITELEEQRFKLLGSLLYFTQVFYKVRTGRTFDVSEPISRESHHITICRELTLILQCKTQLLRIHVPPRYGKTELLIHFVAWAMAHYPDSNFIYVSYSYSLAEKQTQTIKEIISLPYYKRLFGVKIKQDIKSKGDFETTAGGSVYAAGSGGTITGRGAGIQGVKRFGGCFIMDDMHKPDEVASDKIRDGVNEWYYNTAQSRVNNPSVTPRIGMGQLLHENDIFSTFTQEKGWKACIIPALDSNNNALNQSMHNTYQLLKMQDENPYHFSAQYQQNPQPAGGGIFKPEWIQIIDEDQDIFATFITADTAETSKSYNDASVFSFWGIHKIKHFGEDTGLFGLQWIDCIEIRVEPKELQNEFMSFYADCMRYKIKPEIVAIEKKSTGVTLASVVGTLQGLNTIPFDPGTTSKVDRFLSVQPHLAQKLISIKRDTKHKDMCIEHLRRITANNSHRHDDIADTMYSAIKVALIDKTLIYRSQSNTVTSTVVKIFNNKWNEIEQLKHKVKW